MGGLLPLMLFAQAAAVPAAKPAEPVGHLREVVIDAIRNCPKPIGDEIVVCSRDRGIAEGYRIPKLDPRFAGNLRPSGRGELSGADVASVAPGACSTVGAVGSSSCSLKDYKSWGQWKAERKAEGQPFPW